MQNEKPTPLMRYGVAVGTIALAVALTFPLMHFIDSSAFALFFVAVLLSAWYGGLGPGLLATGCAVVAIDDLLLPPFGTLTLDLRSLLRLGVFVFVALVINSLTSGRKQAEAALRHSQADLELRV